MIRRVKVRLITEAGPIIIEVRPDRAPHSATAFLRYVGQKRYHNGSFTRAVRPDNDPNVSAINVVQAAVALNSGAPTFVPHESTRRSGLKHIDGAVALVRGALGTGTPTGFFISLGRQSCLDAGGARHPDRGGFAVFGRVLHGMPVVRRIHQGATRCQAPVPALAGQLLVKPVRIISVCALPP